MFPSGLNFLHPFQLNCHLPPAVSIDLKVLGSLKVSGSLNEQNLREWVYELAGGGSEVTEYSGTVIR